MTALVPFAERQIIYMSVYSWASITEGYLAWKFFDGEL